jgi:hypothetical protein
LFQRLMSSRSSSLSSSLSQVFRSAGQARSK